MRFPLQILVAFLVVALLSALAFLSVVTLGETRRPKLTIPQNRNETQPVEDSDPLRSVTYDERAFRIQGKRQLLLTGAIHYPRATTEMWSDLFYQMGHAGLNTVETYVFWNLHEPERGVLQFDGNKDLRAFVKLAAKHNLYVVLRFGPYVCAEWNYGGFPAWLREISGMEFRTKNAPFQREMERFLHLFVDYMRDLFYENGGPVILLQVENEYGNVEREYGPDGHAYIEWAAQLTKTMNTSLPWFMCQQDNVSSLINACNGFYCDDWVGGARRPYPKQPAMFTELWTGWFSAWGDVLPRRPAQDVAYSVARWFARGGTYLAYYMWFGGTNFGRTAGGPGLITSYDYDAPVDEYGMENEPKFSHLAHLHRNLNTYAEVLLYGKREEIRDDEDPNMETHWFQKDDESLVFLSNTAEKGEPKTFMLGRLKVDVPRWSVTLVHVPANGAGEPKVLYNTATFGIRVSKTSYQYETMRRASLDRVTVAKEPIGVWNSDSALFHTTPLEQVATTRDKTDYLWYELKEYFPEVPPNATTVQLTFTEVTDYVTVYVDGVVVGRARGGTNVTMACPPSLCMEFARLKVLTQTMGLSNYGVHREQWSRGITGRVWWSVDVASVPAVDLTERGWLHQAGLRGEKYELFTGYPRNAFDSVDSPIVEGLAWYRVEIPRLPHISSNRGYAVDLSGMGKGHAWMNGYPLGRYWNISAQLPTTPTDPSPYPDLPLGEEECDYAGPFQADKCRDARQVGTPTQSLYHVPMAWWNLARDVGGPNILVLLEEQGGNLESIRAVEISRVFTSPLVVQS